jgi:nucleotide-binding universal stress UspA family protein
MKVIIAIDQTENWKQIIEAVINRPWPPDSIFRIVSVLEPIEEDAHTHGLSLIIKEARLHKSQMADKILHEARTLLARCFPECIVYSEVRKGKAQEELVSAATNWMVDKIILGAHGRSANRLIPGTVSRFVAKHSPCSVELVRLKPLPVMDAEPAYV